MSEKELKKEIRETVAHTRWQIRYIKKLKKIGASNYEISGAVGLPANHPAITESGGGK